VKQYRVFHKWMLNGHPSNIDRACKRFIRRGVNHGLICTATTNGVHAVHSWHHPDAHGIGHAADMGLEARLVGTQEGLRRMVGFQHHESQNPSRFNELFGPDNWTNVKNGSHMTLAEGTALENQHDNHVHGAPRK
jgi:hypothetical protein